MTSEQRAAASAALQQGMQLFPHLYNDFVIRPGTQ